MKDQGLSLPFRRDPGSHLLAEVQLGPHGNLETESCPQDIPVSCPPWGAGNQQFGQK